MGTVSSSPRRVLVSFASPQPKYQRAQAYACRRAEQLGYFDLILPYQATDLGREFHEKHQDILRHERGYGYWIWKPYVMLKTFQQLEEGDMAFHCDADHVLLKSPEPLFQLLQSETQPLLPITYTGFEDSAYVKADLFELMGVESPSTRTHVWAGAYLIRKEAESERFLKDWHACLSEEHIISETASYLAPARGGFVAHRHDQSVYSLLLKKYGYRYHLFEELFLSSQERNTGRAVLLPFDIRRVLKERLHYHSLPWYARGSAWVKSLCRRLFGVSLLA